MSVSRVGGSAQTKIIKKLGGGVRLDLAQYRELAAFSQFASDLDEGTRKQLERGQRVTALMSQAQYSPLSTSELGLVLFAANEGFLDDIEVSKVGDFEEALRAYAGSEKSEFMASVNESGKFNDDIAGEMRSLIEDFKSKSTW